MGTLMGMQQLAKRTKYASSDCSCELLIACSYLWVVDIISGEWTGVRVCVGGGGYADLYPV